MKNGKFNAPTERDGLPEFVCYRYNAAPERNWNCICFQRAHIQISASLNPGRGRIIGRFMFHNYRYVTPVGLLGLG